MDLNAVADEGISELMSDSTTQQPASEPESVATVTATPVSTTTQSVFLLGDGCCSASEGYATSQDSLTSSETISITGETEMEQELGQHPSFVEDMSPAEFNSPSPDATLKAVDSLTLAMMELHSETATQQQQQQIPHSNRSQPVPPPPLSLGRKPVKKQQKQQRSSSMKSHKTPPDTPNQIKKAVRFADAFGLDLTYVKHVFDADKPPVIPAQATRDLNPASLVASSGAGAFMFRDPKSEPLQPPNERSLLISPCFAQPGNSANFLPRVLAQKVVLERASVLPSQQGSGIHAVARVSNIGFEKSVLARVTFDSWRSASDVHAQYVVDSSNGGTDQFEFTVPLPANFGIGDRVAFCVRYCVLGETYWDNNFGDNYSFDCFAINRNCDVSSSEHGWTRYM